MQPKRQNVLRELNTLRKQLEPFQKFRTLYDKHKKALQPEDQSIPDVYYVESLLQENKPKEALEWALSDFKVLEYNQDLKCLIGLIYYGQKMYPQALQYFNKLDHQSNKQQFLPEWYKDGTLQTCQSVSVELLITALFRRGWLEDRLNNDAQRAVKSYEECFNLISSNVQAIAYQCSSDKAASAGTLSSSSSVDDVIDLPLYSYRAYQCIVHISRIMLSTGQLSPCLTNVRASLQLSSHLEDFFHRKMLFKLGLLTFHHLSPVDWHAINPQLFAASTSYSAVKKHDCYIPRSMDEEAILALMVHQRLCQLTLQRSIRHKHRRRAQELRLQKLREQQKAFTHQQTLQRLQSSQQMQHSSAQTLVIREDDLKDEHKHNNSDDDEEESKRTLAELPLSSISPRADADASSAVSSLQQAVNAKYILKDDETEKIENENLLSLLFLTILLSVKREFYGLTKCILRSLQSNQIDCRRWYKYALSLYGNNQLNECIRACHHSLQHDTTINTVAYKGVDTGVLRHYFILSSCLLAARSALLLHDDKSAMSYGRAAVRLSLDSQYLAAVAQQYTQKTKIELISYILVDQRCIAYLLFSIACSQSAYSDTLCSFEDRKSLHKLAMKSVIRACILSPRNQTIVFNLALCRADLGDVEGALDDVRSLLQNLHPFHAESWHLLSLLLSSRRKWMESYRAIDQALRYCTFISSSSLNKFNRGNYHSLRVFYKSKLKLTKIKILMKQNRISSPLQIFNELSKLLDFNERFYKMAKLPNSHKLCPLFQPLSSKSNAEVLQIVNEDDSRSRTSTQYKTGEREHIMFSLLLLRLEYILTLTSFYVQESVAANKYAFHCMEFALQFFGASIKNDYFQRYDFNRAIQAKILSDIYCKMGECCELLQHSSLALSHYKTAITYNASHTNALIGQSRVYLLNNDVLQSKSFIDTALKINAYSHQAWSVLAQIQQQQKLHEQASNSYLTSLELQRDQPIECYSLVPRWLPS